MMGESEQRRAAWPVRAAGAGIALTALSIGALVWWLGMRDCGGGKDDLEGALGAFALFGSLAATLIGVVVTALRRWSAGILIILASATTAAVTFVAALSCGA